MAETTATDNKKIHFDITKHTSDECLTAINALTNGATSDFFIKMSEIITKNNSAWYGSIDAPADVSLLTFDSQIRCLYYLARPSK